MTQDAAVRYARDGHCSRSCHTRGRPALLPSAFFVLHAGVVRVGGIAPCLFPESLGGLRAARCARGGRPRAALSWPRRRLYPDAREGTPGGAERGTPGHSAPCSFSSSAAGLKENRPGATWRLSGHAGRRRPRRGKRQTPTGTSLPRRRVVKSAPCCRAAVGQHVRPHCTPTD